MKKQLLHADTLDDFICRADAKIFVDTATMILTAGAKDKLGERKISIVHGPCPNAATCGLHAPSGKNALSGCVGSDCAGGGANAGFERLLVGVAAMLQSEYGVTDPEQLKALSLQAVKVIKNNIC